MEIKKRDLNICCLRESGATLQSIAETYNVTRERIRQIEKKVKHQIKKQKSGEFTDRLSIRAANALRNAGIKNDADVKLFIVSGCRRILLSKGFGRKSWENVFEVLGIPIGKIRALYWCREDCPSDWVNCPLRKNIKNDIF